MANTDMTGAYLNQAIPGVVQAISQIFDPAQRMRLEQFKNEQQLYPLKMENLQGQTSLNAARAITEGAHAGLYNTQANDQRVITGGRQALMGAIPALPSPVEQATQQFNNSLPGIPGAPQPHPAVPMVAPLSNAPGAVGMQPQASSPDAPNPLFPSLQAQPMPLSQMANIGYAMQKNPNPAQLIDAQAKIQALQNPNDINALNGSVIAQGGIPNINSALTPGRQDQMINNRNQQATNIQLMKEAGMGDRNDADNVAAGQRTIAGALVKAVHGGGSAQALRYADERKMSQDAGGVADRVFQLSRDPSGQPVSNFGADINPDAVAQRDYLAKRIEGHLVNRVPIDQARDMAMTELFGSANPGDQSYFYPGSTGTFGLGKKGFYALNVNKDALGNVQRETAVGGGHLGEIFSKLGLGNVQVPGNPAASQPVAPTAAPTSINEVMGPPAPVDTTFDVRPTEADVRTEKMNKAVVETKRAELSEVEKRIKDGTHSVADGGPIGGIRAMLNGGSPYVKNNNDDHNALLKRRAELMAEIAQLEPKKAETPRNVQKLDDIARKYSAP